MAESLEQKAKLYALKAHEEVNQKYGKILPYSFHLSMVVKIARDFIYLIAEEEKEEVLCGCWLHDVLEDTHKTYNDILKELGETCAEYSYALANEKGRTRKERANEKYYLGIKFYKNSTFIKLCDRIANSNFSKNCGNSSMFEKYQKEYDFMRSILYDVRYEDLWKELEKTLFK